MKPANGDRFPLEAWCSCSAAHDGARLQHAGSQRFARAFALCTARHISATPSFCEALQRQNAAATPIVQRSPRMYMRRRTVQHRSSSCISQMQHRQCPATGMARSPAGLPGLHLAGLPRRRRRLAEEDPVGVIARSGPEEAAAAVRRVRAGPKVAECPDRRPPQEGHVLEEGRGCGPKGAGTSTLAPLGPAALQEGRSRGAGLGWVCGISCEYALACA